MAIDVAGLHALASTMGVEVVHHTGGAPGWYDHARRVISMRRGQSPRQYRSVLAHELGHAHYRDVPTGKGHFDQRQERRADRWAADLLISAVELRAASAWHHGNLPAIADELDVTKHLLAIWIGTQHAA